MLRRAENVKLTHQPGFWTGKGPAILQIGKNTYLLDKMSKEDFAELRQGQRQRPISVGRVSDRKYWYFQDKFYWDNDDLAADQVRALLVTREQRRIQQIERAQSTLAAGASPRNSPRRKSIPDDVKQYVWVRDEARCRSCGSTSELQFDHIIPVSMGGSSHEQNLQILCGPCNRSKAAGLTTRR